MLDDIQQIEKIDTENALGIAAGQWQQLLQDYEIAPFTELDEFPIRNIVVAGMGGSALAASIVQASWPKAMVPFEILRDYDIPLYVDNSTLFIASSYSGNTEETLAALHAAEGRDARIAVIASGGELGALAQQKAYPYAKLPTGYQPRHATLSNFKALIALLQPTGLIGPNKIQDMQQAADFLKTTVVAWQPDVPITNNPAKQLALACQDKSPVIYAGPKLFPAAYKWKISFNENAKNVAWCDQFPEFDHNEFLGWTARPTNKPYTVIELRSNLEHSQVQKRFETTGRLESGRWPTPHVVQAEGVTLLEQLLWTVALGDFVSLYLAVLNGVDPTPVELLEELKRNLNAA